MKKKIVLVVIFLILMIVTCSFAEQKHFKGYGIETWTDNDKLTVKTDDSEFSVKILPKKFTREESFAYHCWVGVLSVQLSSNMEINEKILKVEEIQHFVEILAKRIKKGKMDFEDVSIEMNDMRKALKVFWSMFFVAADRLVGNEDGFCSDAETHKLEMYLQSRVVTMMTKTIK